MTVPPWRGSAGFTARCVQGFSVGFETTGTAATRLPLLPHRRGEKAGNRAGRQAKKLGSTQSRSAGPTALFGGLEGNAVHQRGGDPGHLLGVAGARDADAGAAEDLFQADDAGA